MNIHDFALEKNIPQQDNLFAKTLPLQQQIRLFGDSQNLMHLQPNIFLIIPLHRIFSTNGNTNIPNQKISLIIFKDPDV